MLIALPMPQATLIGGMPSALRRGALAPVSGNFLLRAIFTVLTNAWVVTALFVAALFVWQYPPLHDAAILDGPIHDVMHVTMPAAGLLFCGGYSIMRRAPIGLGYGSQLMMIWITALSQIGLGAYLALKSTVLYPAHYQVGRLFGVNPLTGEVTGAFIIWVPSAMRLLISAIIIIHMGKMRGTHLGAARPKWTPSNSEAMRYPTTDAALIELARLNNRKLAISAVGFVFAVFAMTMLTGVLYHLNAVEHNHALPIYAGHMVAIH